MNRNVEKIVTAPGRKKILTIDGGGTRAIISVEMLACLEDMLRRELKADEDFVLADYFDFIAGTSAGASIACFLSLGISVKEIRALAKKYLRLSFNKKVFLGGWRAKFDSSSMISGAKKLFGENTLLGTDRLRTLLMLVMRNASTESLWPVTNNPYAVFNRRDMAGCNLDIPLWQLIRASSAAPPLFAPQKITLDEHEFIFEDGAISPYNNPAFLAFLQATVEPYNINWTTGEEKILVVSVGNGRYSGKCDTFHPMGRTLLENARTLPLSLLRAVTDEQDMLCRVFGRCLTGPFLDSELGDLIDSKEPASPKMFTYIRYNYDITDTFFREVGLEDVNLDVVKSVAAPEYLDELEEIGTVIAGHLVGREHYRDFLFKNTNNV